MEHFVNSDRTVLFQLITFQLLVSAKRATLGVPKKPLFTNICFGRKVHPGPSPFHHWHIFTRCRTPLAQSRAVLGFSTRLGLEFAHFLFPFLDDPHADDRVLFRFYGKLLGGKAVQDPGYGPVTMLFFNVDISRKLKFQFRLCARNGLLLFRS